MKLNLGCTRVWSQLIRVAADKEVTLISTAFIRCALFMLFNWLPVSVTNSYQQDKQLQWRGKAAQDRGNGSDLDSQVSAALWRLQSGTVVLHYDGGARLCRCLIYALSAASDLIAHVGGSQLYGVISSAERSAHACRLRSTFSKMYFSLWRLSIGIMWFLWGVKWLIQLVFQM